MKAWLLYLTLFLSPRKKGNADFPGLTDALAGLGKKLHDTVTELAKSLTHVKKDVSALYVEAMVVQASLDESPDSVAADALSDEARNIIKKYDAESASSDSPVAIAIGRASLSMISMPLRLFCCFAVESLEVAGIEVLCS